MLPEEIQKKRDELNPYRDVTSGSPNESHWERSCFRRGFNQAWELALEMIKPTIEFYAQDPIPDKESIFAKSAMEFGEHVATWEPLLDMGEKARELKKRLEL